MAWSSRTDDASLGMPGSEKPVGMGLSMVTDLSPRRLATACRRCSSPSPPLDGPDSASTTSQSHTLPRAPPRPHSPTPSPHSPSAPWRRLVRAQPTPWVSCPASPPLAVVVSSHVPSPTLPCHRHPHRLSLALPLRPDMPLLLAIVSRSGGNSVRGAPSPRSLRRTLTVARAPPPGRRRLSSHRRCAYCRSFPSAFTQS